MDPHEGPVYILKSDKPTFKDALIQAAFTTGATIVVAVAVNLMTRGLKAVTAKIEARKNKSLENE